MVTGGLVAVCGALSWLSLSIAAALAVGRVIALVSRPDEEHPSVDTVGDLEEIWSQQDAERERRAALEELWENRPGPLLGVVHPRHPDDTA